MKFNLDKTDYILYPESIYKSKVRLRYCWCVLGLVLVMAWCCFIQYCC